MNIFIYPSAGIGRQCKLKFCWLVAVNVQVVPWISKIKKNKKKLITKELYSGLYFIEAQKKLIK